MCRRCGYFGAADPVGLRAHRNAGRPQVTGRLLSTLLPGQMNEESFGLHRGEAPKARAQDVRDRRVRSTSILQNPVVVPSGSEPDVRLPPLLEGASPMLRLFKGS